MDLEADYDGITKKRSRLAIKRKIIYKIYFINTQKSALPIADFVFT